MIRIIDKSGSGKTKTLMQYAKDNNATFVCANPQAMKVKAKAYGLGDIKIISYHNFVTDYTDENFVIDEAEEFIKSTMGDNKFIGYSLTIGD